MSAPPRHMFTAMRVALLCAFGSAFLAGCGQESAAPAAVPAAPVVAEPDAAPIQQLPAGSIEAVALEIGGALDADGRVSASTERFRSADTVYASLVTVGDAPAAMLRVQWRDAGGAEVAADDRAVQTAGPAVHTFSRAVQGGWAPGRYEVEVRLNDTSAGVRSFEVR